MTADLWTEVDAYFDARFVGEDEALRRAEEDSRTAGLPDIAVSHLAGKFLHLLARMAGARTVLEIGTLGGYSTIWLARAVPAGGRVVTIEGEARHAEIARANVDRAEVGERVDILTGHAQDCLDRLVEEKAGPFDLVFIDADKAGIPSYIETALRVSRPGTVMVVDNVVRAGGVIDPDTADADLRGIRRMADMVAAHPRLDATALQTVGVKGHDGFALILVGP